MFLIVLHIISVNRDTMDDIVAEPIPKNVIDKAVYAVDSKLNEKEPGDVIKTGAKIEPAIENEHQKGDRKRERESDDSELPTAKKRFAKVVNPKSIALKITDLNIDCLEHICTFLTFTDLLNASNAIPITFNDAAQMVFSRRYSKRLIKMNAQEMPHLIKIKSSAININTISLCAQVLTNFGDSIEKLELTDFTSIPANRLMEIKNKLNKNCTDHLTELKLINCKDELFEGIKTVFKKVESLRISCSNLGKCIDLGKWFPALKRLELVHNDGCIQIVSNLPFLSFLAMDIKDACLSSTQFETMIKSAPQLQTLALSGGITSSTLHMISKQLPSLKCLYLWDFHLDDQTEQTISFKNVETFSISTGLLGELPHVIPFRFGKLTELRVNADLPGEEWLHFAIQQKNLRKLQLNSTLIPLDIFGDDLAKIAISLNDLTELDVTVGITPSGLTRFLSLAKQLRKFRIKITDTANFPALRQVAGKKWRVTENSNAIIFERDHE